MKNTYPSYYKKFRCIADKCPDTCCAGWAVAVDGKSRSEYMQVSGDFGNKIRSVMTVDEDGDTVFTNINGSCPFLLKNGLCEMYINLGEASLCRTCTLFPRHISFFGARKETGISFSCPEAARLITESSDPITFVEEEEDGEIQPNSIDPNLYFTLLKGRKTAINILQNRKYPLKSRLIAFLRFSDALQKSIRAFSPAPDAEVSFFDKTQFKKSRAKKATEKYFADLISLEKLDAEWNSALLSAINSDLSALSGSSDSEWEAEHFAVYLVFRYFLTAAYDGDILTKSKFTVFAVITASNPALSSDFTKKEARIKAMQKWSKEVEHSAENMATLTRLIKKSKFYSTDNLINILSEE